MDLLQELPGAPSAQSYKDLLQVPCKERLARTKSDATAKRMKAAWWNRLCREDPDHKKMLLEATGWSAAEVNRLRS